MKQYLLQSIIADDTSLIPYRKELNQLTGSVTATILLTQILYWWKNKKRTPFYKFRTPCKHEDYTPGDSWCEELGFGEKELDNAISAICQKTREARKDKKHIDNEAKGYVRCWQTMDRKTYYEVNEELLETDLKELFERLANPRNGDYVTSEREISQPPNGGLDYIDTENTQKNTTENTKKPINPFPNRENKPKNKCEAQPIPHGLNTPDFAWAWAQLLETKKWRNKEASSINLALKKLSVYDVAFAIQLVETATMGGYQGVVFGNTPQEYEKWQKTKQANTQTFQQAHPNFPNKPLYVPLFADKWIKVKNWRVALAELENGQDKEFSLVEISKMLQHTEPLNIQNYVKTI